MSYEGLRNYEIVLRIYPQIRKLFSYFSDIETGLAVLKLSVFKRHGERRSGWRSWLRSLCGYW